MNVNEQERYDRQIRLWGKGGQEKINNAQVAVIGSGPLARDLSMSLTALGVGQIRLIGSGNLNDEKFLDIPVEGNAVDEYKRVLNKINPNVNVNVLTSSLESRLMQYFLRDVKAIVETTNNPRSKALTHEYAKKANIPVFSASSMQGYAKATPYFGGDITLDHLMPNFEGHKQDDLISVGFGGVLAEEVKKVILEEDIRLSKPVYYKLGRGERFAFKKSEDKTPVIDNKIYKKLSVGVVGAGALGCVAAILLSKIGFGQVNYYDYDVIQSHNLTRQILYYDCVDLSKADAIVKKHSAMNPACKVKGFAEKFQINEGVYSIDKFNPNGYDLLFDLVDNKYTRAMLAAYAVTNNIPLVSAASSPDASEWVVYQPGKTPCLDHVFHGYYEKGLEEEIIRRRSCTEDPNPAVIMTNQIAASFAVLESLTIFQPEEFGEPFKGAFKYSTIKDSRLSTRGINEVCDCHITKNVPNMEIKS
ncbi:ThiF family adenylyltransferase [archaeon]|nr:ThiF family adenylyltransferase [archaeon]